MSSPVRGSSPPLFFPSSERSNHIGTDGQRTPRAARQAAYSAAGTPRGPRGSSPLRYLSDSLRSELALSAASTPRARRGDINPSTTNNTPRRTFLMSDATGMRFSAEGELRSESTLTDDARVIWGTSISIPDLQSDFRRFITSFKPKYRMVLDGQNVESGQGENLSYLDKLNSMRLLGLVNMNLDIRDVEAYPMTQTLHRQILDYPQEVVPLFDHTLKDLIIEAALEDNVTAEEMADIERQLYKVRPFNIGTSRNMRELNPDDIDTLVCIKGLVIRTTPIIPDMRTAFFTCNVCNHSVTVEIDKGRIMEPTKCPRRACEQRETMVLVHHRSEFSDKQVVKLQETPDAIPDGQTPHSVSLVAYDEIVDVCKAGDRVQVTGIFRSVPVRVNPRMRAVKTLFKTYIDVLHVAKVDRRRLGLDVTTLADEVMQGDTSEEVRKLSAEEVARVRQIADRPDRYELLARSLAPSIWEMEDVKKGILLQLFGGSNKNFTRGAAPRYRGDINVLLCGDPSTSKSQILQYVNKIAPRGVYTSGKGSSAVGLTAYVTRDVDTKQLVLESGALVLSDGGVCCIDEFDKMSEATRSVLHEVMEQQTVSVAKAGIITTLNARTSILASANPIGSRYDPELPVPQNIDLPPTLLSRFDLVYLVLDRVDEAADRRLARHLVGMYIEDTPQTARGAGETISVDLLTSYISYARTEVKPVITEDAGAELVRAYVAMRKLGEDPRASERRITATTRQLESLIRLSEAHAKMRLSQEVDLDDVLEAVRLVKAAVKEYATDKRTGKIDLDLIQVGASAAQRRARQDLRREVARLIDGSAAARQPTGLRVLDLARLMQEQSSTQVDPTELAEVLRMLEAEGDVRLQGEGGRKVVRKLGSGSLAS